MSACDLAALYRQEADDLMRAHRRLPEDDHTLALLAAARLAYFRALRVLLWLRIERLEK